MPTSYDFLTFSDLSGMRNASAKVQIRKHAMKDIGVSRRRPRGRWRSRCEQVRLEVRPSSGNIMQPDRISTEVVARMHSDALAPHSGHDLPVVDDKRVYDACIRSISCRLDPFDTTPIRIDGTVRSLLQYFVYYSTNFPNNWTFTPSIDKVVAAALRDRLTIHCLLSAASSRVQYVQGVTVPRFQKQGLVSEQQALWLLQQGLSRTTTQSSDTAERLLQSVLYLGAAAIYRQDFVAAKIHTGAAVQLAETLGGVADIEDPFVLVRILSQDDLLSCQELKPCRVSSSYDPGPALGSSQSIDYGKVIPDEDGSAKGFLLKDDIMLPAALRRLIFQILECNSIKRNLGKAESTLLPDAYTIRHWLTLRTLSIRNQLLAFTTSDSKVDALRVVLIMWTLLPPNDLRQARTAQVVAGKLKDILQKLSIMNWTHNEDILFWCLLMGYFCAQQAGEVHAWFAEEIRNVRRLKATALGLDTCVDSLLEELIEFQRKFLFRGPVLRPLTEKLAQYLLWWDDVLEG